jgi:hypothetical protein
MIWPVIYFWGSWGWKAIAWQTFQEWVLGADDSGEKNDESGV